jgi:uncharacterized membrane protein (UPF0127 family)
MPWLVRDGEVLASLDVASGRRDRRTGLLGKEDYDRVLLIQPCRSVHTMGMRFAIDVAHLDSSLTVLRVTTMRPWRLGRPVGGARSVLEAAAGTFASIGLKVGDVVELKQ